MVKSADGVLVAGVKVSHVNMMGLSCGLSDEVGNDLPVVAWCSCIVPNVFMNNCLSMKRPDLHDELLNYSWENVIPVTVSI